MKEQKSNPGALIASIVIVIILVIGGYYSIKNKGLTPDVLPELDGVTSGLSTQSDSTELQDIEKDLQNTNIDAISADIQEEPVQ
ncbi:MAG: hypothetical protein WC797_00210 [Candidatus Paceibacterota bacterium]|jgi:hypothetical protein